MVRQVLNIEKEHLVCQVRKSVFVKYAVSLVIKIGIKCTFPDTKEDGALTNTHKQIKCFDMSCEQNEIHKYI
jgi:hypothetical protein